MSERETGSESEHGSQETVDSFLEALAGAPSVSAPHSARTHLTGAGQVGRAGRDLAPGDRLPDSEGDRYEVIEELGRGGFGAVYLARDLKMGRHVAIKMIGLGRARGLSSAELQFFDREAKATARLSSSHIVTVYDSGTWEGLPYLVLERLKGEPLSERLRRGPLGVVETVATGIHVSRGLVHAHGAGVLHLDLKPHNVFVCEDGVVKILDLGLAQLDPSLESLRSALQQSPAELADALDSPMTGGTPAYMAPEQWRGENPDERTDLWAMGVILFETLSGRLPFKVTSAGSTALSIYPAPPVTEHVPLVAPELVRLIARCLEKERGNRFASARELLDELHAVERLLAGPVADTEQPYRYLEPFTEADAAWFFGRDREARRLMGMLENRPLVALVGPSGAGKSSLVQAGLVPRLRRGERPWTVISMRPGNNPLGLLESRLGELNGDVADVTHKPGRVGQVLRTHAKGTGHRVLLYVDQLEELFTHVEDADVRAAFAAALLSAADDPSAPVRVVLTVRGDFLGELAQHPALRDQVSSNNLILGPPDVEAMTEALVEPARRLAYDFEEGLASQMVRALQEEAAPLPLLQLAASRLWDKRDPQRRLLTRLVLDDLGGVAGVLAAHAEEVLQQIPAESEQWIAREVFLRLVTADGTRKPIDRDSLLAIFPDGAEAGRILEHLLRGRLLTSSKRDGKVWIELAHEALALRWDRLSVWLGDEKEHRLFHERVTQAAALWDEKGRPGSLLWTKQAQADAARWRTEFRGALAPAEIAFLDGCAARKRRRRRTRRLVFTAAVILAIAGAIGALFWKQAYDRAQHAAWVGAVVRAAAQTDDPLLGALLLSELAGEKAPPGGLKAARRIASRPIPLARFRGRGMPTRDGSRVVVVAGESQRIPKRGRSRTLKIIADTVRVWRADGTGPPTVIRTGRGWLAGAPFGGWSGDRSRFLWVTEKWLVRIFRVDGRGHPVELRGPSKWIDGRITPHGIVTVDLEGRNHALWKTDGSRVLRILRSPRFGSPLKPAWKFSRDLRFFAVRRAGDSPFVRVFDLKRGGEPVHIRTRAVGAAVGPGGRIFTGNYVRKDVSTVGVWDLDRPRESRILKVAGAQQWLFPSDASPDGKRVLAFSTGVLWSLDAMGQSPPITFSLKKGWAWGRGRFSQDGREVVFSDSPSTVAIARSDGRGRRRVLFASGPRPWGGFVGDGSRVLTSSREGATRIWLTRGSREPAILGGHSSTVKRVVYSPDGRWIATLASDGTTRLFRADGSWGVVLTQDTPQFFSFASASAAVRAACSGPFSPEGSRIAFASRDGTVRVWRLPRVRGALKPAFQTPTLLRGHKGPVPFLSFSADGRRLLSSGKDGTVRLWRSDGAGKPVLLVRGPKRANLAVFVPGGRRIFVHKQGDPTARVWTLGPGGPGNGDSLPVLGAPSLLRGHEDDLSYFDFTADGSRMLTASKDTTARVWWLDGSRPPVVLRGHRAALHVASFSPDGTRVATGSEDTTARVWWLDGSREPLVLRGHTNGVRVVKFSPDGVQVLTRAGRDDAFIWDLRSLRSKGGRPGSGSLRPRKLGGQQKATGPIFAGFSPDGSHAFTLSLEGTARVWRLDGPREPELFTAGGNASDAAFSPDGTRFAMTGAQVHIFRIGWKNVVTYLRAATNACLWPKERMKYLAEARETARARSAACEARYGRPAPRE